MTHRQEEVVHIPRDHPALNAMAAIMSQGLLTVTLVRGKLGHIAMVETTVVTGLGIDVHKTAQRQTTLSIHAHLHGTEPVSNVTVWDILSVSARVPST